MRVVVAQRAASTATDRDEVGPDVDTSRRQPAGGALDRVLAEGAITTLYQPIVHLASGETLGYEALAQARGLAAAPSRPAVRGGGRGGACCRTATVRQSQSSARSPGSGPGPHVIVVP
ncbi:MAG: hypothetical protein ABW167_01710 [Baekduia sp.]